MNDDLISRSKLANEAAVYYGFLASYSEHTADDVESAYEKLKNLIKFAPPAGAEYVVPCEECMYNAANGGDCKRRLALLRSDTDLGTKHVEYIRPDYCSYGVRMVQHEILPIPDSPEAGEKGGDEV